jgi:hypothetical protein
MRGIGRREKEEFCSTKLEQLFLASGIYLCTLRQESVRICFAYQVLDINHCVVCITYMATGSWLDSRFQVNRY